MNACKHPTQHDWVVENMYSVEGIRAFYHVICANCGQRRKGKVDNIPTARFASSGELKKILNNHESNQRQ